MELTAALATPLGAGRSRSVRDHSSLLYLALLFVVLDAAAVA